MRTTTRKEGAVGQAKSGGDRALRAMRIDSVRSVIRPLAVAAILAAALAANAQVPPGGVQPGGPAGLTGSLQPAGLTEEDLLAALEQQAIDLVAAQHQADPDDLEIVNSSVAHYRWLRLSAFAYKIEDVNTGETYGIELDQFGEETNPGELEHADFELYRNRFGKLTPELAAILPTLQPGEKIPVSIRVNQPGFQGLMRPSPNGDLTRQEIDLIAANQRELRQQYVSDVLEPVVGLLQSAGYANMPGVYSTTIRAELDASIIGALEAMPEVWQISYLEKPTPLLDNAVVNIAADDVHADGYTGSGVRIAQVEAEGGRVGLGEPYLASVNQDTTYSCWITNHARLVALVMYSVDAVHTGISYGVDLWAGGSCSSSWSELMDQCYSAVSWGAHAINLSYGANNSGVMTSEDEDYDELVQDSWVTVVVAAGNSEVTAHVEVPATAYNVIAVGNYDDNGTPELSDDTIASSSAYRDPSSKYGDREKPEVAAPGTSIEVTPNGSTYITASGTSLAAPMVTGTAALLMDRDYNLSVWPEAVKAILLATAWNNVSGSSTSPDNKDGAGGIRCKRAGNVANGTRGDWGGESYSCSTSSNFDVETMVLYAGRRVRVAIAWDQNPSYSKYDDKPSADLDLKVISPLGSVIAGSYSYDNTYEWVDFTPDLTGSYTIRVSQYRCNKTPKWLGWAWHQTQ